jgi:teichuronic acid exporter
MSVKADVLNALRWTAAGRLAAQVVSWAITIYVIRILQPSDYGLMSMASILMPFATLLYELGLVPALIQARQVDEELVRQLLGFVLASTLLVFCVLFLAAPVLAAFFGEPRLTPITRVLAVGMVIGSVSAVPNALLERQLQFRGLSIVEFSAVIIGSAVTLALAMASFGVWSLVAGNLVAATIKTVGICIVSQFWLTPMFGLARLRSIARFGANITGQRILWYAYSTVDVLLIGKLLGDHALGVYSVALQLALLPASKMFGILNRVAFPAYAQLQHDTEQARDYFIGSVRLVWLVFCPMLWGLSSVSPDFVQVFLGQSWGEAVVVLTLIPLIVPFRIILLLIAPVTDGLGRPDIGLRNLLTSTALIPLGILLGIRGGLPGVCVGLIIASIVALAINSRRSLGLLQLRLQTLLLAIAPTAIAGGFMYACVSLARTVGFVDSPPLWRLCGSVMTGIAVYTAVSYLINRGVIREFFTLIRAAI